VAVDVRILSESSCQASKREALLCAAARRTQPPARSSGRGMRSGLRKRAYDQIAKKGK